MAHNRNREEQSWITRSKFEIKNEEEFLECKRIVLKIVRYMKDNHLTQKELASRLNVTPQYINKLLHGEDIDLKISTAIRYGRLLGVKLIEIPSDTSSDNPPQTYYTTNIKINKESSPPSDFLYSSILPTRNLSTQEL